VIWLNDRLVATQDAVIPVTDRSFLLGEGVFETIRTQNGESVALDRHLKRMRKGATVLEITIPKDDFFRSAVSEVLSATKEISIGRMRITVSGSGNLVITGVVTYPFPLNERSLLANVKSTSYATSLSAHKYATARNADDAILFGSKGQLAEASTANIFLLLGNKLVTPNLDSGALPGITRELVLEWGLAQEAELNFDDLAKAEGALLSSSLRYLQPIDRINARSFKVSKKIEEIMTSFTEQLSTNLNP
jgi:branched-chain amino acid aminotransferase